MYVSVIIPTYQRCISLKRALIALCNQTFPKENYEVIVSIDGSTDSTKEMLTSFEAPYKLRTIWKPNAGRAAARNSGISEAKGDVLIFLDDDLEASPDLIEQHYKHHINNKRICVLGYSPLIISDHSSPLEIYIAETIYTPFMKRLVSPDYKFQGLDFDSENFSIRKEVIEEIGSFYHEYSANEDMELGLRMVYAGIEIIAKPNAVSRQYLEKDFDGFVRYTAEQARDEVIFTLNYPNTFCFSQICEYNQGTLKWRLFRAGLIWLSFLFPKFPSLVVYIIKLLEKYTPNRMHRFYSLSLDYFFWFGVFSTIKSLKNQEELISKIKSHKEPRRYDFISTLV